MSDATAGFGAGEQATAKALVAAAIEEDLSGQQDATSRALIPESARSRVQIVARQSGVLCGVPIGRMVLEQIDPQAEWTTVLDDGQVLAPEAVVAVLEGPVRSLLTAERTILNFMTHLSGVASLTRRFVEAVEASLADVLDTRKTLPGWRRLQKYAVRCGGGTNHRMGLWDAVLIKDNHLAALAESHGQSLADVVRTARENAPQSTPVEIEVDTLEQLVDALAGRPDVVLLDNMSCETMRQAAALRDHEAPEVRLEASGGVTLDSVAEIAKTGVERISVGALTHSAPALDLAFDWPK